MIRRHASKLLFAFLVMGLFVSGWSFVNHYRTESTSGCDVNRTFNCDVVNRGLYSEIGGVPVAAIGIGGYLLLGLLALLWKKNKDMLMLKAFIGFAIGGLLFSAYLTYIEAFVLATYCLLCLASLSCIVGATLCGTMVYQTHVPKPAAKR